MKVARGRSATVGERVRGAQASARPRLGCTLSAPGRDQQVRRRGALGEPGGRGMQVPL